MIRDKLLQIQRGSILRCPELHDTISRNLDVRTSTTSDSLLLLPLKPRHQRPIHTHKQEKRPLHKPLDIGRGAEVGRDVVRAPGLGDRVEEAVDV